LNHRERKKKKKKVQLAASRERGGTAKRDSQPVFERVTMEGLSIGGKGEAVLVGGLLGKKKQTQRGKKEGQRLRPKKKKRGGDTFGNHLIRKSSTEGKDSFRWGEEGSRIGRVSKISPSKKKKKGKKQRRGK